MIKYLNYLRIIQPFCLTSNTINFLDFYNNITYFSFNNKIQIIPRLPTIIYPTLPTLNPLDYLVYSENSVDLKIDRLYRSDNGRIPYMVDQVEAWVEKESPYRIRVGIPFAYILISINVFLM